MAKSTQDKLKESKEKLKTVKGSGEPADKKAALTLRAAKKKVKRAQRKLKVEKSMDALKAGYETKRQANIDKAKEKEAKKKAASEAALNAAAEKQAAAEAGSEG